MDEITLRPISNPLDRTVCLPGSKSLTNRALLVASLADGVSQIDNLLLADDTRIMLDALTTLGVRVELDEERHRAVVHGCAGHWPNFEGDIFCGNAGTVIRFLTAACCIAHGDYRLDGVSRMRERPLGLLVDAMRDLGASIGYESEEGYCPLTIRARGLRGGKVRFKSPPSSQFVSAILMAAPYAATDVMLDVGGELPSKPYVQMTLDVMEHFGVSAIEQEMRKFIIPAQQRYQNTRYDVEPDASAASYFFAAAAVAGGRITVDGLGTESCQGDWHFVDVLEQMGCTVERCPRSTTVHGPPDGELHGVDVDLNAMPDVAQTLAIVAVFAQGPTTIRNIANLRLKETDRLTALANELKRIGVTVDLQEDSLTVNPDKAPIPATIETYGDHRMAMSFAVAGLRMTGLTIRDPGCVSKTFPEFFEIWTGLGN